MRHRAFTIIGFVTVVISTLALASTPILGQASRAAAAKRSSVQRTPDGHPDLQGVWNAGTITSLERPAQFAGKLTVTEAEAQAYATEFLETNSLDRRERDRNRTTGKQGPGGYNEFWVDRGTQLARVDGTIRTSLIVDPADGLLPPITPEARERDAARGGLPARPDIVERQGSDDREHDYDNPEQRPLAERCLLGFGSTSGPPALPVLYNNFKQIVQTPDRVLILTEMVHDARTVRIGGQHLPPNVRFWKGDSVGHWEGDTLVVDTTNFTDKTRFRGSSVNLHVIERFTRTDADTILYRFTVDDPTTWTKSWSGEYTWNATGDRLFEYACHEGNYALPAILAGARAADKRTAGQDSRQN